ncbi:MAG TPA: glycoside hydrolase family 28 protein [Verrucomicrobiae bacterium]|jgi:polygalacturonase
MKKIKACSIAAIAVVAVCLFTNTSMAVSLPVFPKHHVSLTDFGAVNDGVTLNTEAFSNAIAALSVKGGGELIVPAGYWLTGPIKLESNINLHLERGALIQFSRDYHLYPLMVFDMKGEKSVDSTSPITGQDLENVAITGEGIIDGGGDAWRMIKKEKLGTMEWDALVASGGVLDADGTTWWPNTNIMSGAKIAARLMSEGSLNLADYEPAHESMRPKMVHLVGIKKLLLQGVTFQNPPNWTLNPALCENVTILDVKVHNAYSAQNSDALDLESCRHVLIQDSTFDAGDDGICFKSGKDAAGRRIGVPDEDVTVKGCTVYHAHGGFVIGSEMSGGMKNIHVDNCTFIGTDNGLRFKSARGRGGVVEDIHISNIRMENILQDAIVFEMYYEKKGADMSGTNMPPVNEGTPLFRDIHFENIICRGAQKAMVLTGLPEMPIRDFDFKNVSISARLGAFVTDANNITFDNVHVDCRTGAPLTEKRVTNSKLDLVQ